MLARTAILSTIILSPLWAQVQTANRTTLPSSKIIRVIENPPITDAMLREWLGNWQRRLGLTEWVIEAKIVRLTDLQKGTIANIHWSLPKRTATIKVLDPVDSTLTKSEVIRDTELSVVHELIHLSLAKLPLDGGDNELEEEMVNKISKALVALDKSR